MSDQYFKERLNNPDNVERTDHNTNNPVVNSDPFVDKDPVDAALINETPMGGTVAAVGPMNGPLADEIPMLATPIQEIPMGGTVAAVGSMAETVAHESTTDETLPYKAPVGETIADDESRVNKSIPFKAPVPMGDKITHETPVSANTGSLATLLTPEESKDFRTRWNEIQGKFVDEPRLAVQQADGLVSEVVEKITQMFAHEHSLLESQWKQGNDVSTEDLRKALQHYRSFFNRLVV